MGEIRPLVKYHGGKGRLWKWIVPLLPEGKVYIEPFGGAASVLLNRRRSEVERYGDIEPRIVNLLKVVRDHTEEFVSAISDVAYARETYQEYRERYFDDSFDGLAPFDMAVLTYVVRRMSRGGLCGTFCWSNRVYSTGPAEIHCWDSALRNIGPVGDRLKGVEIMEEDAFSLIERSDSPDTVFYLDPPYVHSTRSSPDLYVCEMGDLDHRRLLDTIKGLSGKVVLSGYRSTLYDRSLSGWWVAGRDVANHSSHRSVTKERKVECLYCNFAVAGGELVEDAVRPQDDHGV